MMTSTRFIAYKVNKKSYLCVISKQTAMAKMAEDTPLIRQFFEVKAQHPEALLLYRVGDFYETYSDDAVTASRVLGLVLT